MKWKSGLCEVNGSKKMDINEVLLMWWEINPIWEHHSGGDYILNLWR
jgi:hypothetical protein